MKKPYLVYLRHIESDDEFTVGEFKNLSAALVNARVACREAGISNWDWFVDKRADDYSIINRRSSLAGLES